jgi:hypothetical protein
MNILKALGLSVAVSLVMVLATVSAGAIIAKAYELAEMLYGEVFAGIVAIFLIVTLGTFPVFYVALIKGE